MRLGKVRGKPQGMPRPRSHSSEAKPVGVPCKCARWHMYRPEKPLPTRFYQQCRQRQQIRDLLASDPMRFYDEQGTAA